MKRAVLTLSVLSLLIAHSTVIEYNYRPAVNNLSKFPPEVLKKALPELNAVKSFKCSQKGCKVVLKPFLTELSFKHTSPFMFLDLKRAIGLLPFYRYDRQTLLDSSQRVVQYLKNKGYLDASAYAELNIDKEGFAKLKIVVSEGTPYFWGGFKFKNGCFKADYFYKRFNRPLGKPFSYIDLYDALDLTQLLCNLEKFRTVFVYYREPFEVKNEPLINFLWKDFRIKPALGFEFISDYVNLLLVNPYKGVKFLFSKSNVVYPEIDIVYPSERGIEIKGIRSLPDEALKELEAEIKLAKNTSELVKLIKDTYRKFGFLEVSVKVKRDRNGKRVLVVKEGAKYTFVVKVVIGNRELFSQELSYPINREEVLERIKRRLLYRYGLRVYLFESEEITNTKEKRVILLLKPKVVEKIRCQKRYNFGVAIRGLDEYLKEIANGYSCYQLLFSPQSDGELKKNLLQALNYYACNSAEVRVLKRKLNGVWTVEISARCDGVAKFGKTLFWVEGRLPSREISYMLPTLEGKRFKPKLVNLLNNKISESGLFQTYTLKRVRAKGREYLLLEAVEKPPLEVSGAISYTTDEGFSLELNTHLNDVFKTGERIGVGFYLGQKRQTYEINYFDNYFFSHHYFVGLSIFKKFEEHRDFDLNSKGFSATFGRHLNLYTDLSANFLWNDFKLTNFPLRGKETKYILNLQFNYPIYIGPFRKGGLTNFASLSYSPNFGGFEKFENKFGLYLNLRKLFIGNKLSFGAVSKNAPPFEKFYLGGLKDLKGYTYEAIAPYGGGSYYWYYGLEVGVPVVSSIYLFTGFDTGNSVNNAKELFKNVKSDAFLGAGTVSALGPIRFGVAFPYENNRFKLKDFKIFMSVGFQF